VLPYATAADQRYRARVRAWSEARLARFDDEAASDAQCVALVGEMGKAGLLRAIAPGGRGIRSTAIAAAREEIARLSPLADALYAMQGLGSYPVLLGGSAALQARIIPAVVSGALLAAFAITEEHAGSDVAALATRARKDGSGYVLEGEKRFISNAGIAGFYTVFASTDPGAGARGVSAFLVEADNPGLEVIERTALIAPHPIGRLRFDRARVKAGARLGAEGDGLKLALATLDVFRATVGAAACGMARRALDETLARVQSRRQFGQPIGAFQGTRFRLAEMALRLEAARGLVFRATWTRDRGERPTLAAAMAKLAATDWGFAIVDDALQLHGGDGVVKGSAVERLYREVRALRIYEGTSEIQRLVIARELLDRKR
jgi:acyl-CoA dehydrogenase